MHYVKHNRTIISKKREKGKKEERRGRRGDRERKGKEGEREGRNNEKSKSLSAKILRNQDVSL